MHEEALGPWLSVKCTAKSLIRLGGSQDDLSLRWAHEPICWFCHAAAHLFSGDGCFNAIAVLPDVFVEENEPPHEKTNKMACAPSEDSDQPEHPPSLVRVLAVRMKKSLAIH